MMQGVPYVCFSTLSIYVIILCHAGAHLPQDRAMALGRDGHPLQARAVHAARRPQGVLPHATAGNSSALGLCRRPGYARRGCMALCLALNMWL